VVKRRVKWIAVGALTLPLLACQLLAGIEERYEAEAGPDATAKDARPDVTRDAGREATPDGKPVVDAGPDRVNACPPGAEPPPPPKSSSMTMEGPIDFVVGVRSLWYDLGADAGLPLGFDLDNACTCEGKPPGAGSCSNEAGVTCDGDGGRDLAGNALLVDFDELGGKSVAQLFNSKIASGQITLILRVGNYNVGADDLNVNVSPFVSGGLLRDGEPDSGYMPPIWNGTDVWSIDPASTSAVSVLDDGGYHYTPLFVDTAAYITNYTLVSHLDTIELGVGQADLSMSDATLMATITPDGMGGYTLTGQFAGRIAASTIFAIASTFPDPMTDGGQSFCGSDPTFQDLIRPTICSRTDIMSKTSQDNTGAGCDAISVAIGFVADKVVIGVPHTGITPAAGCDGSVANCSGL
jgi:hypothetical protein